MRQLFLLLCLFLTACSSTASVSPTSSDSAAIAPQPSATQAKASRIVALTSLSADIVGYLDQSKLVGISGSRLLSNDARFQGLPRVGQGRTPPNLEAIAALNPDLVIGAVGFHDPALARLKELGIATLPTEVTSLTQLETLTRQLAERVGADPAPLLQRFKSCTQPLPQSATTLVLVSQQPLLAPNKTSWTGDLLAQLKIKNLTADLQGSSPTKGYITLSGEKVLQSNPEVLIVVDTEPGTVERLKTLPFWSQLKATQKQQVHVFDYYGLINPGSLAKVEQTCAQLKQILSP